MRLIRIRYDCARNGSNIQRYIFFMNVPPSVMNDLPSCMRIFVQGDTISVIHCPSFHFMTIFSTPLCQTSFSLAYLCLFLIIFHSLCQASLFHFISPLLLITLYASSLILQLSLKVISNLYCPVPHVLIPSILPMYDLGTIKDSPVSVMSLSLQVSLIFPQSYVKHESCIISGR